MRAHCRLLRDDQQFIEQALTRLELSARAYHRMLKIARTIADLSDSETIQRPHLAEALSYRIINRNSRSSNVL